LADFTKADRYIITSAQNNTPVDKKFWAAIKAWAKHYDAQILVIPILYRVGTVLSEDIFWPREVEPYLVQNEVQLAPGVRVFGDLKIGATAVNPLSGLEAMSQGDSAIIGHAQIQMKTVATPQNKLPKILQTTGTTSQKNYSDTKAGKKGDFHHSLGAAIVEIDEPLFHIRCVTGDNKSEFYDLDLHCTSRGVKKVNKIEGIVLGDEHVMFSCPEVRAATFVLDDSIVSTLKPKYIVRHDLIDSYSVSHWHNSDPATQFKKHITGENSLLAELHMTAKYLEATTPTGS
jgi:hypothetical protein